MPVPNFGTNSGSDTGNTGNENIESLGLDFIEETHSEAIVKSLEVLKTLPLSKMGISFYEFSADKYKNLEYDNLTMTITVGDKVGVFPISFEEGGKREIKNIASFAKEARVRLGLEQNIDPKEFKELAMMNLTFSDTVNSYFAKTIKDGLSGMPEFQGKKLIYLDTFLFNKHNDINDKEQLKAIFIKVINNAVAAMRDAIGNSVITTIENIKGANGEGDVTINSSVVSEGVRTTISNLPVRADFKIAMKALTTASGTYKPNAGTASTHEVEGSGYMDFNLVPVPVNNTTVLLPGVQNKTDFAIRPNIIMTGFKSKHRTLSDLMLAVANMSQTVYEHGWIPVYSTIIDRDKGAKKNMRSKTIGDLYPMLFAGTVAATPGAKPVKEQDLYQLDPVSRVATIRRLVDLKRLLTPYLSYIAPIFSDDSASRVLVKVASGNDEARKLLFKTLNTLTKGHFPMEYRKQVFYDNGIGVPMGLYANAQGEARPFQDVDIFTAMTIGGDDMAKLHNRFTSHVVKSDTSFIQEALVYDSCGLGAGKVYLKAPKLTFTNEFLTDFNNALKAAGLTVTVNATSNQTSEISYGSYVDIEPLKATFTSTVVSNPFQGMNFSDQGGVGFF